MLLRYAKLAGGLRILIAEVAPLVFASASLLTARSAAYVVGFTLGSIGVTLWPIVVALVAISGIFGTASTEECETYFTELKRIDDYNRALMEPFQRAMEEWSKNIFIPYSEARTKWDIEERTKALNHCFATVCSYNHDLPFLCSGCIQNANTLVYPIPEPEPPSPPVFLTYDGVSTPPDCPANKKVWLQTMWVSPSEFASQSKGCFIIGYSHNALDGLKIEYNPFKIPEPYLKSNSMNPTLVFGNRFRGLTDQDWQDLESSKGWDKGYWSSEFTDVECRGWRPGWSNKVK